MIEWRREKPLQNKTDEVPFRPKVPSSSSLNSQEIVDVVRPEIGATKVLDGMCRSEPLTDTGKRLQLLKILSLTLLPILGLWAFTVYSLSDSIQGKFDIEQNLDPNNYDIYVEMEFYSFLIERFIEWMYGAIKESNMASIWKILVAYQKIVTVMEHIGIERALGTVFYVEGGFPTQSVYERYNNRVNIFKANYRSAVLYSKAVDPIFQEGVTATGTNLTAVIERFRFEIQHTMNTDASITKGQWWFDNMTLYLDTLLIIQQELAGLINGQLEEIIQAEEKNLTISACFLVIVILMCPLVIYTVEALTSDIQKYAIALVHKTKELSKEKKKMDELLYQMVPRPVADRLKMTKEVDAEYFKSVTIMFSDIFGFTRISQECSPLEIVNLLNVLYTEIDERLDHYDVYKVEAINDSYMVASGLPTRIGNRHSAEVANLALDLLSMVMDNRFTTPMERMIQLRIGINTG
ncbi:guanylate cyclase 32E [Elysia marginata]|uniref:guanylate cyclase n=1 Tax=Elysia marginata TaxID=1093978 RepID=A0AAV4EGE0_9GAST|nr:guanylate cyclase 32E [Elysia marginata]